MYCLEARVRVKCDNPFCDNYFFADKSMYRDPNCKFCRECRSKHSYYVLCLQAREKKPIRKIMLAASQVFHTVTGISDYLGISPPTFYHWLRLYFGMDFQSWKRHHICKAKKCMALDFLDMPVVYKYHLAETIRRNNSCACFTSVGGQDLLITSARASKLRDIFRYSPEVVKDGSGINKIRYPVKTINLYPDEWSHGRVGMGRTPVLDLESDELITPVLNLESDELEKK